MSLDGIYFGVGRKRTPPMANLKVVLIFNSFRQVQYGRLFVLCHSKLYHFLLLTHGGNSLIFTPVLQMLLATFSLELGFLMCLRLEMIASGPVGFCSLD